MKSFPDALPRLALLAIACGLMVGCLMLSFRQIVEGLQASFLPGRDPENYEGLAAIWRLSVPLAGALLLGFILNPLPAAAREVGPAHVIDAFHRWGGRLPLRNALVQFGGGALSIVAGHSVGREGPAIHLGAASASWIGHMFRLSDAHLRVLAASGIAAAIAASFNTPLAGVVFAMEVVLREYSVVGFAPVILAAVSATAVSRVAYGADTAFAVPALALRSLWELPYILGVGAAIGVLSSAFTALLQACSVRARRAPYWLSATLGGAVVGAVALLRPEVMSIGYDTVNLALLGKVSLATLATIALFKLVATTVGVGLGLPGGLIGPMLVIGAAGGGALGIVGASIAPAHASSAGFYALIGMGAMMAGTLHAPLAALTAMLELTGNPNIIWPGMLATIAAFGTCRDIFGQEAVFSALLHAWRRSEPQSLN